MDTAVTGKVNSQKKLNWSSVMLDDMVDIICSKIILKKFLTLEIKNAQLTLIYSRKLRKK